MNGRIRGVVIATAVAGLFIAQGAFAGEEGGAKGEAKVACEGINSCKGQGACSGVGHDCAGHNACKGKGWIETSSAKECTDKGGTVKK
jgi:hypothetical protein